MSLEIRPALTDAEWRRHAFISAYSFNGDRSEARADLRDEYLLRDWSLAAYEDGTMVAGLMMIPFEQYINGASIPLGGVAGVSCLPEKRRQGYVGELLRASLQRMRDDGQFLSALYTPHYSLYRRFGWEIASRTISYSFAPKVARPRRAVPAGSWRRLGADAWRDFDAIYTRHYASRNGAMRRSKLRWRTSILTGHPSHPHDAAIWSDATGEDRAYVVYSSRNYASPSSPWEELVLRVHDWVALDPDAYAAVLYYLLSHDLSNRIVMLAGEDEPFAAAFEEPSHIGDPPGAWFATMLRIVDVPRALEARPALPQADDKSITIALEDEAAPWNAGTWRIACSGGRIRVERSAGAPDLEMEVTALGPLFNGFTKPADAVRAGTVRAHNVEAVAAATDIFSVTHAPYCPDEF